MLPTTGTSPATLLQALANINVHDHLCLICDTQEEQLRVAIPFIKQGLAENQRCIYVADEIRAETILEELAAVGVDVAGVQRSGALTVAAPQDAFLKQGQCDPDEMIGLLAKATEEAQQTGFAALRLTGALGSAIGAERLIEYEAKLDQFLSRHAALAICQYDRARFAPQIIRGLIRTHPRVITGGMVCQNAFYMPPGEVLRPDPEAEVSRLLGQIQDWQETSRRRDDEAFQRQAELLRNTERLTRVGGWEYDVDREAFTWTMGTYRIHELDPSECPPGDRSLLQRSLECYDPGDREIILEDFRRCVADGRPYDHEFQFTTCKGRRIWIRTISRAHLEDGRVVKVTGNIQDISEQKATEQALRQERDFARSLVETAQVIVLVLDTAGRIVDFNPYMENLSGYRLEEVRGKDWFETFLSGEDRGQIRTLFQQAVGDIQTRGNVNAILTKDGRALTIEWYDKTLKDGGGSVIGLLTIGQDVTERTLLETQLRQSQKMEAVGTLAGGIAHDFNNILAAIQGFAELALDDAEQGKASTDELQDILRASGRGRELVRQIVTFSRRPEAESVSVDLNQGVLRATELIQETLPKMITVELKLSPEPLTVLANSNQLEQVLVNLCSNARDAMPEGGQLGISTEAVTVADARCAPCGGIFFGPYIRLSVSDTGHGMDADTCRQIFDPFFTTKDVGQGTGLGLSMVYGIVAGHQGHIGCISEPGAGTTISVYLPPHTPLQTGVRADDAQVASGTSVGTETILLVDDEETLRRIGQRILGGQGYQVMLAENGETALEIYRQHGAAIDLVILDISMPGMGGNRCLRELIKMDPEVKVLVASGYASRCDHGVGSSITDGRDYLPKPFTKHELVAKVRTILDRRA